MMPFPVKVTVATRAPHVDDVHQATLPGFAPDLAFEIETTTSHSLHRDIE